MTQAATFNTTKGLRKALADGELKTNGTVYVEMDDGLFMVDYHFIDRKRRIRLEDILICVPTEEIRDGKPVLEAVECDTDPKVLFDELADIYDYEK